MLNGFLPSWQDSFVFRQKFYDERNIKVHLNTEVTDIIREEKFLIAGGESYRYDKAILDLGSIPIIPPIPGLNGENEFYLDTNLETARLLEEAISKYSSAAIVGTGQIALDVAEVLKAKIMTKYTFWAGQIVSSEHTWIRIWQKSLKEG